MTAKIAASAKVAGLVHEKTKSGTVEWYTPPWLFVLLGLKFDTDVASPGAEIVPWVPATIHLTVKENALSPDTPWSGDVWCNHPYADRDADWVRRFIEHGHGVGICHARTDTSWCKRLIRECDLVVFTKRIRFVQNVGGKPVQGGSPGCGQMLYARGSRFAKAIALIASDPRIAGCIAKGWA